MDYANLESRSGFGGNTRLGCLLWISRSPQRNWRSSWMADSMQGDQDDARIMEIAARGYRVIRFWNGEVMENLAGVLEVIRRELTIFLSAPPRQGGEELRAAAGSHRNGGQFGRAWICATRSELNGRPAQRWLYSPTLAL